MSVEPQKMERRIAPFRSLDAFRGLACLAVVVFHVISELRLIGWEILPRSAQTLAMSGYLGVQIFFVVSGYCIAQAAFNALNGEKTVFGFIRARVKRIYPPMWWSLAFYALIKLVASLGGNSVTFFGGAPAVSVLGQDFVFYFANLSLTQRPLGTVYLSRVCWSLCYEIAFYFLIAIGLAFFQRRLRGVRGLLNVAHFATVCSLIALWVWPTVRVFPFDLWPQFGAGVMVFDLLNGPRTATQKAFAIAVVAAWCFAVLAFDLPMGHNGGSSRLQLVVVAAVAALLMAVRRFDIPVERILGKMGLSGVGRISYSVYLIHYLVISTGMRLLGKLPLDIVIVRMAAVLLFGSALIAGYLFYRKFERNAPSKSAKLPLVSVDTALTRGA